MCNMLGVCMPLKIHLLSLDTMSGESILVLVVLMGEIPKRVLQHLPDSSRPTLRRNCVSSWKMPALQHRKRSPICGVSYTWRRATDRPWLQCPLPTRCSVTRWRTRTRHCPPKCLSCNRSSGFSSCCVKTTIWNFRYAARNNYQC